MKRLVRIKMFGKNAHTREFRDPDRWRAFFHNRLWIGLPVAPVILFIAGFLQFRLGEGLPFAQAAGKGAIDAALGALAYIIGVWASTAPEEPETTEEDGVHSDRWWARLFAWTLALAAVALLCSSQIAKLWTGDISLTRGLGQIFTKLVCIAAVITPVLIAHKRK